NDLRRTGSLDVAKIEARIDAFAAHLKTAKMRDAAKYTNFPKYVWPNNFVGATWEDEIKFLKFWIRTRLDWVDRHLPGTCAATPNPPAVMQVPQPMSAKVERNKPEQELYGGERIDDA